MDNRKLIRNIEKNVGIKRLKNQINSINLLTVFLVVVSAYSLYLNHSGWLLSYGIIVAAIAMIVLALFISYRVKLQVKLSELKLDYRSLIVKPCAREYIENGDFLAQGILSETEIISTCMFSDKPEFTYESKNELTGVYKGKKFKNYDLLEVNHSEDLKVYGRIFDIEIETPNVNPVVLTTSTAPIIEFYHERRVHLMKPENDVIDRMFRVYAFDEKEANSLFTENTIYKLKQLVGLQLGKIIKIAYHNDHIQIFFTTDGFSYEETLTKKHKIEDEVAKVRNTFGAAARLIDII